MSYNNFPYYPNGRLQMHDMGWANMNTMTRPPSEPNRETAEQQQQIQVNSTIDADIGKQS